MPLNVTFNEGSNNFVTIAGLNGSTSISRPIPRICMLTVILMNYSKGLWYWQDRSLREYLRRRLRIGIILYARALILDHFYLVFQQWTGNEELLWPYKYSGLPGTSLTMLALLSNLRRLFTVKSKAWLARWRFCRWGDWKGRRQSCGSKECVVHRFESNTMARLGGGKGAYVSALLVSCSAPCLKTFLHDLFCN